MRYKLPISRRSTVLLLGLCLAVVAGLCSVRPIRVRHRIDQARRALAERDAEGALVWLGQAEQLDPDRGETQFWMARAYRRLGQAEPFRTHLVRAGEWGYPVEALDREKTLGLVQTGRLPPNDAALSALMLDPGDDALEIYEAVVRGYLETYHVGPALALLDAWQADYPDDPQSYFYRGLIWTHQEEWSKAADAFRQVLRTSPERYDARLPFARALREDYHYREALAHYRACLEEKETPEGLLGVGLCLEALGEDDEARETYHRLLSIAPDDYEGRLALGKLEFSVGNAEEAVGWLEPAAKQRPNEVDVRHTLAWALLAAGRKEEARQNFEFSVKAQEAAFRVKYLMRHADAHPENVELRYQLGALLLEYGQSATALGWLDSALQLDPYHAPTHAALADYYASQGNEAAAAEHRRLAGPQAGH